MKNSNKTATHMAKYFYSDSSFGSPASGPQRGCVNVDIQVVAIAAATSVTER